MSATAPNAAQVADEVRSRLEAFFAERTRAADVHGQAYRHLWELTGPAAAGGKLLRPLLLLHMVQALAPGARPEGAADVATALELLHFAFLLHDDVLDGDLTRRGRPNLLGALLREAPATATPERARHWATTGGLLMGDLLLARALAAVEEAPLAPTQRDRLRRLFHQAIEVSVAGELTDVGLGDAVLRADAATVLGMTRSKTAHYTFVLPLRAAAVLAHEGENGEVEAVLADVGEHLGLAFQLQDDLLSVFGEPGEHGKEPLADLREHKQTMLMVLAARTAAWPDVQDLMSAGPGPDEARAVADLLASCGARAAVETMVEDEFAAAARRAAALPRAAADLIATLTRSLRGRPA